VLYIKSVIYAKLALCLNENAVYHIIMVNCDIPYTLCMLLCVNVLKQSFGFFVFVKIMQINKKRLYKFHTNSFNNTTGLLFLYML